MAQIRITFLENLIVDSTVSFNIRELSTDTLTPVTFIYKAARLNPFEVPKDFGASLPTGTQPAKNLEVAANLDLPTYTTQQLNNVLTITSPSSDFQFEGGIAMRSESVPANVNFIVSSDEIEDIEVTGLEENGYLINNEIWVEMFSINPVTYFNISFINNSNGNTSLPFLSSAFDSATRINVSPIIKSMFDYAGVRNDNIFTITITDSNGVQVIISKTFIRGGERTQETNTYLPSGTILRPSTKLPIWDGYPTLEYFLDENYIIQTRDISSVSSSLKDYKRVKGCNNIYFKFANQQGGYSNWLFESFGETESGGSEGAFIRNNKVEDFGGNAESTINIYSKVPKEYIGLIKDLVVSHEIYIYRDVDFVRVTALKNNIEQDDSKRAYTVKLKFDMNYRFNPESIW